MLVISLNTSISILDFLRFYLLTILHCEFQICLLVLMYLRIQELHQVQIYQLFHRSRRKTLRSSITEANRKLHLWNYNLLLLHHSGAFARVYTSPSSSLSPSISLCICIIHYLKCYTSPPSSSPLQDIMNTPKFQVRKLQRQMIKERDYRDGLEREVSSKLAIIAQKGNGCYTYIRNISVHTCCI